MMMFPDVAWKLFLQVIVLGMILGRCMHGDGEVAGALPPSLAQHRCDTARNLAGMIPGHGKAALPQTFYPRAELESQWARVADDPELLRVADAARARADRHLAIPVEQWIKMMPDRSPAPLCDYPNPGSSNYLNADPLSGTRTGSGWLREVDLHRAPFQATSAFGDHTVYEFVEDIPADSPFQVKGYEEFMHWDGVPRRLYYTYSPIELDGRPMRVYPENLVWSRRLGQIVGNWRGGVIPDLRDAYLATGDEKYAELLVVLLERLAEIFPNMPLGYYNGIDQQSRDDLVAKAARHEAVGWHGWLGPSRLTASATNFRPPGEGVAAGILARAFLAVEHAAAWGGDEATAKARRERVRQGLLAEMALLFHSYGAYNCVGNAIGMYAPGLIGLGVAMQDRYLFDGYNAILEDFLYNENYYDGTTIEGSLNYAGMVGGMWDMWREREEYEPDCLERHPFVAACGRTVERMTGVRGARSQHGDGPNQAFMLNPAGPRQDAEGREIREPSEAFGGCGISILRGGGAGRRLEVFFHHQRLVGHAHPDMLGVQVHYRGIPVINHLGDSRWGRFLDLDEETSADAAKLRSLHYPRPMVESEPGDRQGWAYGLNNSVLTKNTLVIDEYGWRHGRLPWRGRWTKAVRPFGNLRYFKGAADPDGPAALLQVAEATGEDIMKLHMQEPREFRRTLVMVARPDGRPYLVDLFRADGGNRHLLLWHSPGEATDGTMATTGEPAAANLDEWLDLIVRRDFTKDGENEAGQMRRGEWQPPVVQDRQLASITAVHEQRRPSGNWHHTWRHDAAAWAPKTGPNAFSIEEWRKRDLLPVHLRLHGVQLAGGRRPDYLLQAKSAWPAIIEEHFHDKRVWGMVRFRDGLDYVGAMHASPSRLDHTHVHVLDPWVEGEEPVIARIVPLSPESGEPPRGAVALRVEFADGTADLVAALPEGAGELVFADGLAVSGRFALVRLDAGGAVHAARLIGGARLAYRGEELIGRQALDLTGALAGVEGDLSGDRSTSALMVRPDGDWPMDEALAGRFVTAIYDRGKRFEHYSIDRVETADNGVLRVVLRGAPPFVDFFGTVDDAGFGRFTGDPISKGAAFESTGYLMNSRVGFPERGLSFTLKHFAGHNERAYEIEEPVDLGAAGIVPGSHFVIFPDMSGALVRIAGEGKFMKESELR